MFVLPLEEFKKILGGKSQEVPQKGKLEFKEYPKEDNFLPLSTSQKSTNEVLLVSTEGSSKTNELSVKQIEYLRAFCRNIIKLELEKFAKNTRNL
jgi:hypothetical protein